MRGFPYGKTWRAALDRPENHRDPVNNARIAAAWRTGMIVGATTAGAVIGVGLRHGDALEPFMIAGHALLSTSSGLVPLPWLALAGGLALHLMLMLVVGGLFALVALRARGPVLALGAASYAVCVALAAQWMGPAALGAFGALLSTRPQWIFLMALLASALIAGVRWSRVSS